MNSGQAGRKEHTVRAVLLTSALIAAATPALAGDISGTYVAAGPTIAEILQIVETNGQLQGRFEEQLRVPGGPIKDFNAAMTGSENNGIIVLTMKPDGVLTTSTTLSGNADANGLRLAGGGAQGSFTINLSPGTRSDFDTSIAALKAADAAAEEIDRESALLKEITGEPAMLQAFVAHGRQEAARFSPVLGQISQITRRMRAGLAREREVVGQARSEMNRGPIDVAINQAFLGSQDMFRPIAASANDFETKLAGMESDEKALSEVCGYIESGARPPTDAATAPEWKAKCMTTTAAFVTFEAGLVDLNAFYSRAKKTWTTEGAEQAAIVKQADEEDTP